MSSVAFLHIIVMVNIPTELIKPHSTGPLEAMARNTLSIDLQHAFCILSLYWGKLSSCTTRRRSRTGVYTSGIWGKKRESKLQIWRQEILLYNNVYYNKWCYCMLPCPGGSRCWLLSQGSLAAGRNCLHHLHLTQSSTWSYSAGSVLYTSSLHPVGKPSCMATE